MRQPGYEFVAGMAWHADRERLVISFSVHDRDLFLGVVDADDVRGVLLEIVEHERANLEALAAGRSFLEKLVACQDSSRDASGFERVAKTSEPSSKLNDAGLRSEISRKIWRDTDPYIGFPKHLVPADLQGWNSYHPFLAEAIDKYRPRVVLEVGVWKGASTINMAKRMKACEIDGVVIAVDTWLGSSEHWIQDEWFEILSCDFGYPRIYHQFLANVIESGVKNIVIPLPMDSINAFHVLKDRQIQLDMIHIDGGHDYDSVSADLRLWWSLLSPGGVFIADDYFDNGMWPEVKKAVDDFISETPHKEFGFQNGKSRAIKV